MAHLIEILSVLKLWEVLLFAFAAVAFVFLTAILILAEFCYKYRIQEEEIEMLDRSESFN